MRYSSNVRVQTLEFVNKFLWCDYSNENSQAVLSRGVIYFSSIHEKIICCCLVSGFKHSTSANLSG